MAVMISVVIPAYNRGLMIRHALESVLNQTFPDWEAVVVNDGSTDNTGQVAEQYAAKDPRIRFLQHDRRKGAQAARNTGVRAARGKWIAFLDSDDRWLPSSLEARVKAAGRGAPVVHSECYVLTPQGNLEVFGVPPMKGRVYRELLGRPGPMFQGLLVSREAFARLGSLDEDLVAYQEWDTAIRLARHHAFEFVAEPTFIYDCRHPDTISKNPLREALGYQQVVDKHRWSILVHLGPQALAHHYQRAAFFYQRAKDQRRANRCAVRVAICWPFRRGLVSAAKRRLLKPASKAWIDAEENPCHLKVKISDK